MRAIGKIVSAWQKLKTGQQAVLATVVQVTGSHYRRVGARMLVTDAGDETGTVSAGCLEHDLRDRVREVMAGASATVVRYDTSEANDPIMGSGMGCGGLVEILLQSVTSSVVDRQMTFLDRCCREKCSGALATIYSQSGDTKATAGDIMMFVDGEVDSGFMDETRLRAALSDGLCETYREQRTINRTFTLPKAEIKVLFEFVRPPHSLLLFGAGDDSQLVAALATELDWQVSVVDHRASHANTERFPGAEALIVAQPEEAVKDLVLASYDAALLMTHNYLRDIEILKVLLPTELRYVGMLGAASRVERLLDDLNKSGFHVTSDVLARLYAPVGLDLGADGPNEIALAIMAEMQAVIHGGTGRSLRDTSTTPIVKNRPASLAKGDQR